MPEVVIGQQVTIVDAIDPHHGEPIQIDDTDEDLIEVVEIIGGTEGVVPSRCGTEPAVKFNS